MLLETVDESGARFSESEAMCGRRVQLTADMGTYDYSEK
jgi:hypothetical protein